MSIRPTFGLLIKRPEHARAILLDPLFVAFLLATPLGVAALLLIFQLELALWLSFAWVGGVWVIAGLLDSDLFVSVTVEPTNITIRQWRMFTIDEYKKTIDGRFMLLDVPHDILRPAKKIIFRNYVPHIAEYSFWCFRPQFACDWLNEQRLRLTGCQHIPPAIARSSGGGHRWEGFK